MPRPQWMNIASAHAAHFFKSSADRSVCRRWERRGEVIEDATGGGWKLCKACDRGYRRSQAMSRPQCTHTECQEAADDGDLDQGRCLDCCEHGWSCDNRRGCVECVTDRADWLLDDMRENGGSCAKCVDDHAEGES